MLQICLGINKKKQEKLPKENKGTWIILRQHHMLELPFRHTLSRYETKGFDRRRVIKKRGKNPVPVR